MKKPCLAAIIVTLLLCYSAFPTDWFCCSVHLQNPMPIRIVKPSARECSVVPTPMASQLLQTSLREPVSFKARLPLMSLLVMIPTVLQANHRMVQGRNLSGGCWLKLGYALVAAGGKQWPRQKEEEGQSENWLLEATLYISLFDRGVAWIDCGFNLSVSIIKVGWNTTMYIVEMCML